MLVLTYSKIIYYVHYYKKENVKALYFFVFKKKFYINV